MSAVVRAHFHEASAVEHDDEIRHAHGREPVRRQDRDAAGITASIQRIISVGDLVERSDLRGGRTNWGEVPLRVRNEIIPGAALFRTTGPGIAWPGSGATGHPSRTDVPYPVMIVDEARRAVQDYARMKPEFVKIWVDDRGGRTKKLTPELYLAIVDEAHKQNIPVAAHNVTLADAKLLMKAGVEGWLHLPVRMGEVPDEELIAMIQGRIAQGDRPMWFNPGAGSAASSRDVWNDPLLRDTIPPEEGVLTARRSRPRQPCRTC